MKPLLLSCVCFLIFTHSALADNGQIAYALPMKAITIDGDLSDWPDNMPGYPINGDGSPVAVAGGENYSAFFRAGYNSQNRSIYLAIEVTDQNHSVGDDPEGNWSEQDGMIIYFDANHTTNGSGAALYAVNGPHQQLLSDDGNWDPDVAKASWDNVKVKVNRANQTTVYEWQIQTDKPIAANQTLGLDFLVTDQDVSGEEQSNSLYIWGPNFGKSQGGGRIGDLVLINSQASLGTLKGKLDWQEGNDPADASLRRVRVASVDDPSLWVQTSIDDDGIYQVELPAGSYVISQPDKTIGNPYSNLQVIAPSASTTANVAKGETTTADTMMLSLEEAPDILLDKGVLFDFTADKAAEIDRTVTALMDYYQVPGVSLALVKDGKLVHHSALGLRNAYSKEPMTDDTLLEAASITKAVFAFAANRLIERGVIDPDKPLYQYLPFEEIAHDERYKKITARHVLSHQTGFPNWRWQNDDGQMDIKFYPGIKYGYSGEGFEYLGRVVSEVVGKPLEQIVMEEAQQTMGLTENTHFSANDELRKVVSSGHFNGMAGPYGPPDAIGVAHSMHTEAKSFANFMISLIEQKGLSAEGYANMLEPQVEVPLEPEEIQWPGRYGMGFYLMNSPYGLAYGHGGNNGDFMCQFEIYRDHDMGFAVFTNSNTGVALINALREYLIIGKQPTEETET